MGLAPSLFGNASAAAGHKARAAGKDFEQIILSSQRDEKGQVCYLQHIKNFAKRIPESDERMKALGYKMRLIEEKSPFDFCGVVASSHAGVFFDAKSAGPDEPSFYVNNPKIVKPHQVDALEYLEQGKAFAGFLIRSFRAEKYFFLWASRARRATPVRWNDPALDVLGPIQWGRGVPLRKLFELYP